MLTRFFTLVRPSTWRGVWISIRRSRKDETARKLLLRFLLFLLIAGVWVGIEAKMFLPVILAYRWFFLALLVSIVSLTIAVTSYIRWDARRDSLEAEAASPAIAQELKVAIYGEACLLAAMLFRLGSERAIENKSFQGIDVVTRRMTLDRLGKLRLTETLEPHLLDLLLAPDGHWTEEQKRKIERTWEFLAILHYAIGSGELRPLTHSPEYSFDVAIEIIKVEQPAKLPMIPPWDLRSERDAANIFFHRCWVEIVARGEATNAQPDSLEQALQIRADIQAEGYLGDYLLGATTVSELPSEHLWFAFHRGYQRMTILRLLVEIASGEKHAEALRALLADALAAAPTA